MIKIKILKEREKLKGGAGDNRPDGTFDPKQLAIGIGDETGEHTPDKVIGKEIAKDHLTQDPDYYRKLKAAGLEELQEVKDYNHKQFTEWLADKLKKETDNEDRLLVEAKLSKYWKKRAARRAKNAERPWPNKTDRDWALGQQVKSEAMNQTIHKLFEKELEESDGMVEEIANMMRKIKKQRKEMKLKREASFEKRTGAKKGSLSVPLKPEYGGVKKGADKHIKQIHKKGGAAIAGTGGFGPMEEAKEKQNENN